MMRFIAIVRARFTRRRANAEADDELAFHVEAETRANVARGMTPDAARRRALADLGGVAQTREAVRDVRAGWLDAIWRDVRYASRALRSSPAFSVLALAVLTLSIGATTAIFSVVDGVILRPLPFPDAGRLVAIGERNIRSQAIAGLDGRNLVAPQQFLDWREQQTVFTRIAAVGYAGISLRPEGTQEPETLEAQAVTADFFAVLGEPPLLGRPFTMENEVDGRARVAVISYALWQRRFGGAPDVIGRLLPGQLADFEIVGVMPRSFAYPVGAVHPTEVWIPNVFQAEDRVRANSFSYRLEVLGRLRDGVTIEAAQTQMDQITARLAAATPRWFTDRVAKVEPLREYLTRGVRRWLVMIFASVVVVLLIACVNLSNLTLARAVTRHREVTIRAALGASRWDLARAVLIESLLLSLAGAALGALAAWSGIEVLRAALPEDIPRTANIAIDGRVLAVSALVAIVTGLSFSLAPVIALWRQSHARTTGLTGRANTSAPGHERVRGVLLVAEVSLAVVLLVGAGLFAGSFMRVSHVDLGMNTRDVLTVRIRPFVGGANWKDAQLRHRRLLYDVLDRVRAIPGVDAAAMVTGGLPLSGNLQTQDLSIPGLTLPSNEDLDRNHISVDYFHVLRVPLLKGRLFTESDREQSEPVVIINDVAARRYFPGQDPIGRVIDFEGHRTIVGIVGNIRHEGPETDWRRQGFIPLDQSLATTATLVARLSRPEADVVPDIKAAIWSRFPAVPLPEIRTLDDYLRHMTAERRFNMLLLALFGVLGIVIADVGLYGVMAYVVSQRTREIGIRMALGAQPVTIHRAVLGRAMTYLATGTAIGLLIAWGSTGLVASFLFELGPHDATVYGTVALVFLSIGLLAAFVPARRAARVDPVVALKAE